MHCFLGHRKMSGPKNFAPPCLHNLCHYRHDRTSKITCFIFQSFPPTKWHRPLWTLMAQSVGKMIQENYGKWFWYEYWLFSWFCNPMQVTCRWEGLSNWLVKAVVYWLWTIFSDIKQFQRTLSYVYCLSLTGRSAWGCHYYFTFRQESSTPWDLFYNQ